MDRTLENNLDPPNNVDFAFDRVEDIVHLIQRFYKWLSKVLKLKERQASAKQFTADHPTLCVFIGVAMVMCSIPIFCFFIFAVTTAVILFLGFLFVEGAVIACGLVVLFAILFFVACLSVGCTLLILFIYYISSFLRQLSADVRQRLTPQDVGSHVE